MKKWSKLVLATMLSVGTLLVSGCIENIEPEGIADLRGAKAELLRAQVALQAAQAAKVEADAALVLAQAKVQEAIAKQEEAKAKYEEAVALKAQYEAEAQNITNESARADLEKKIAENEAEIEQAKLDAELYALELQADILAAEEAAIKAQMKVDEAMRDLAVAKATLTDAEAAAISTLETAVTTARNTVESKTTALHNATIALAKAMAEIDETGKSTMVAALEQAVVVAQAELDAALEAEAEAKALLEVDKTIVDWDAKIKEYQAKLDSMGRAYLKYGEEKAALGAEVSYALDQIDDKIELYENTTGYKLDFDTSSDNPLEWGTGLFSNIQGTPTETIDVPDVKIKNEVLGDFTISGETYTYGEEDVIVAMFDNEIRGYQYDAKYYVHYDTYWNEMAEAAIAKKEAGEDYLKKLERYNDAVAATKSGDYLAYFAKHEWTVDNGYAEDYDFVKEVATYNDALKAFNKAIADYEAEEAKLTVDQIKYEEIDNAYDNELAVLDAEKAKGYQDAEAKYKAAFAKYEKAMYVHAAAVEKRDRAIEVAEKTAGATEAVMTAFEATYVEAAASDEDKEKHALYVKALEDIEKARDAYQNPDPEVKTDPESVWTAAVEQWVKDQKLYDYNGGAFDATSVYADIDKAYADKIFDLENKYDIIWADFYAKYPNFSTAYRADWTARLDDLRTELQSAVDALAAPVNDVLREAETPETVEYSVNLYAYDGSDDGTKNLDITNAPSFLIDEDVLVEVVAADLVDKDYFVWEDAANWYEGELIEASLDLWYEAEIEVEFKDGSSDTYYIYADESSEWPYALPDYKTFVEMFNQLVPVADVDEINFTAGQGALADIYMEKLQLEFENAQEDAYYAAIPDHVKAIEAAKAEFIAYVAEKEAEFEAMKAEIEEVTTAFLAAVLPVYEEMLEENAKYEILDFTYSQLKSLLEDYISTFENGASAADLEAFELALQTAYNGAVSARISAEEGLAEAEWAVEEAKAGNLNAVEIAQVKFDRATEELAEAMTKLDKATADLQALLAVIYGTEEETPAA